MKTVLFFLICASASVAAQVAVAPMISQGSEAAPQQFPWFAFINGYNNYQNCEIKCGGSLISNKFVLTAAAPLVNTTEVDVQLGTHIEFYFTEHTIIQRSTYIFFHWGYEHGKSDYNVAVIRLATPIVPNTYVAPVALADSTYSYPSSECVVAGSGKKYAEASYDGLLRWAKVITITNEKCKKAFPTLTDQMICAQGYDSLWTSACYGDEGSAIMVRENNIWTQIGIISYVSELGCTLEMPFVNIRMSVVRSWLGCITGI